MFGKIKKVYEVTVTMNACFAEECLYYKFDLESYSPKQLARKLKKKEWIHYSGEFKSGGAIKKQHIFLNRYNIADITITEVIN